MGKDFLSGSESIQLRGEFSGESVSIEIEDHPEGGITMPRGRYEFIKKKLGEPVENHLLKGYLQPKFGERLSRVKMWFVTTAQETDEVGMRRLRIARALVDNHIDNTTPSLAEAVGIDVDTCRRDLYRLRDDIEGVHYEDGNVSIPESDLMWSLVVYGKQREQQLQRYQEEEDY